MFFLKIYFRTAFRKPYTDNMKSKITAIKTSQKF